ncbi:MAG TPA: long-chain fatty acid--CoA ligase [Kofleriaceae bacterium]|nr:long-chain fatty acid--CoA ligase [Kofleriaceae bacterium]
MPENLLELAAQSLARFADRPLFGEQVDGAWRWLTYGEWQQQVDALRAGLVALGVRAGDRVAIVSRNSAAWATAAYATYGLGATFVPMYEAQRPDDWEFILRDCGAVAVFGRTPAITDAIRAMQPRLPALRHIVTIDATGPGSLATLVEPAATPPAPAALAPDDIAGLIYTSGTTGVPKGALLSHRNLTSNVVACLGGFPVTSEDRTISFLPWAHVYGQVVELHILVAAGASTAFNTDTDRLLDDLRTVRPTMLVAVPRIFNKLHLNVRAQMARRPRVIRGVFERGLDASRRRRRGEPLELRARLALWLAGFLFALVRRKLGGKLKYAISGSATLSREVGEAIDALGIDVYEGYGLTEASPIVTMNSPGCRKLGSVGRPIANVTVEIDPTRGETPGEGEIVVHGPNVMKGYHARPEEEARVFTADGGLRTGDLGRLDEDGFLFITGRIKEQYKLENGKYVMPSPLEERLALSPFIRNVMLHGASRPYNVALVGIDGAQIRSWAAERGITLGPDLTQDDAVRDLIQGELDRGARDFRPYERPVDCLLTEAPFTVENGLLTPTLKLRRRTVVARFGAALDALYDAPHPVMIAPAALQPALAAH